MADLPGISLTDFFPISQSLFSFQNKMHDKMLHTQSYWPCGTFLAIHSCDPGSHPTRATRADVWIGFFSFYLIPWVLPRVLFWGFPVTSNTERFFVFSSHVSQANYYL